MAINPALMQPSAPFTSNIPAAEQVSLQQEAGQLLLQLERAHTTLDILFSVGQNATPTAGELPTLATALHLARGRMTELCERLDGLQRTVGQL